MASGPDTDERVLAAVEAENSGNVHRRRLVIVGRCLDALLRSVLGEEYELEQLS